MLTDGTTTLMNVTILENLILEMHKSGSDLEAELRPAFAGNMACRHCDTGETESQKHLELCPGTIYESRNLDNLNKVYNKSIFWRRMEPILKQIENNNKLL